MNNPQQFERVPYFIFEDREFGIDQERSALEGYDVPKICTFIKITPHGCRDFSEWIASEFIARKKEESRAGRYNPSWIKDFEAGLAAYKEGREIPREGTPTILWKQLLQSRREQLSRNFPTVEDIAAVPDSSVIDMLGLDGRVIRDKARIEIQSNKDVQPLIRELAETKEDNRRLQEMVTELSAKVEEIARKTKRKTQEQETID
jgi:hypothetical protein